MAYGQQSRAPGVYGLDDGAPVAMPGHTPGVQPVVQPRVQQFPIESHDLAFDRAHSVRVEQGLSYGQVEPPVNVGYPQQAPPPPAFAAPEPQMGAAYGAAPTELPAEFLGGTPIHDTYMEPAQPEPMPAPVPAPAPVAAAKTFPEPVHAPGDNRMIKQKVYKGHKNKLVKSLYKTATT